MGFLWLSHGDERNKSGLPFTRSRLWAEKAKVISVKASTLTEVKWVTRLITTSCGDPTRLRRAANQGRSKWARPSRRRLPTVYDDIWIRHSRCWKDMGRDRQYYPVLNEKRRCLLWCRTLERVRHPHLPRFQRRFVAQPQSRRSRHS